MSCLIRDGAGSTDAMLAVFGDETLLRAALRFEAGLAQAQAQAGLVASEDAEAIAAASRCTRCWNSAYVQRTFWCATIRASCWP